MPVVDGDEILKKLVIGVVLIFAIKSFLSSGIFQSPLYKGQGYSVMCPAGFKQAKQPATMGVFANTSYEVDSVTFVHPEEKLAAGEEPSGVSVFGAKLPAPMWISDMFPEILNAIHQSGFEILDKGELKVDDQIAKWVLSRQRNPERMFLEFYVTDEKNGFYKLRLSTAPEKFNKYRQAFDAVRTSFKFSIGLF